MGRNTNDFQKKIALPKRKQQKAQQYTPKLFVGDDQVCAG
jgi:hypothetical protein